MNNDNIISLVPTTKDGDDDSFPTNAYVITDVEGTDFYAEGFAIFTSHHIAIMRDSGNGPIPVLVLPLLRVKAAELMEDEEVFEDVGA